MYALFYKYIHVQGTVLTQLEAMVEAATCLLACGKEMAD